MPRTAEQEAELKQLRQEVSQEDSLSSVETPDTLAPVETQGEGLTGLRTVSKSLFPSGTALAEEEDTPEVLGAKSKIEALELQNQQPGITDEQKNANFAEIRQIKGTAGISSFKEAGKSTLAAVQDVGTLLTRGLQAAFVLATEDSDAALKSLQNPESGIFENPESALPQIAKKLGFDLGNREESDRFYEDLISKTDNKTLKGLLTGVKILANVSLGMVEDPSTFLTGSVKGVSKVPGALKRAERTLKTATEIPGAATAGLSSQLSGVSAEALQEAGLGVGKRAKALKQASEGATFDIGQDLVEKINKFDELIPEAAQINKALESMGDISTNKVIEALENSKISNAATPSAKNANKAINETINTLKGFDDNLTATEFRKLRIQFDEGIEFGKPGFDTVEKAFFSARKAMAEDLIKAARKTGNKDFVSTMKTFSEKLKTRDDLIKLLGKNQTTQLSRAETFANTLFGKGKTARRGLVKKFDEVFGTEFFEQIKTAKLSAELGPKGVPQILPKAGGSRQVATGVLAAIALAPLKPITLPAIAALASPKVSSKLIGLFDLIGEGAFKTTKGLAKLSVKDEAIAAEAFNAIIKSLPEKDTDNLADLMDRRAKSKNAKNKQNIDKRINIILQKGIN